MLKRHQACIDLEHNCLRIQGREIPFLPEHELPNNARHVEEVAEELGEKSGSGGMLIPGSLTGSGSVNPNANAGVAGGATGGGNQGRFPGGGAALGGGGPSARAGTPQITAARFSESDILAVSPACIPLPFKSFVISLANRFVHPLLLLTPRL